MWIAFTLSNFEKKRDDMNYFVDHSLTKARLNDSLVSYKEEQYDKAPASAGAFYCSTKIAAINRRHSIHIKFFIVSKYLFISALSGSICSANAICPRRERRYLSEGISSLFRLILSAAPYL